MLPHQLIEDAAQCQNKALEFDCMNSVKIFTEIFICMATGKNEINLHFSTKKIDVIIIPHIYCFT